jgi:hypothetical protein
MRKDTITGRSFPDSFLNPFRHMNGDLAGDPPADGVISRVAAQGGHEAVGPLMHFLTDYDNFELFRQSNTVQKFINSQNKYPIYTENESFKNGIRFFWRHHRLISLLLGTYSLPYCYAGANGAQVLWISERIKSKTLQRLEETGAFVFGIMQEKDWENGLNFVRVAKIRLLHAAIRWYTLHSSRWNETWGHPVCQEDMAGTNLSFSYIVLKGLRKLAVSVSVCEENDYLHFWNVVGQLMGLYPSLAPANMLEAYRLDKSIAQRQFKPSVAGQGLTRALLKGIEQQVASPSLMGVPAAQMRFFLGDQLADLLGIPLVHWEERFVKLTLPTPIFPSLLSLQKPTSPVLERYWR